MILETKTDAPAFNERVRSQWNGAAAGWNKNGPAIHSWLRDTTDAMLKMADVRAGQTVLDVAAGAGDQTLDIAARVGPQGQVVATDMSTEILEFARSNALSAGHHNIRIHAADAEMLGLENVTFDAAVCRLGLMLMHNPQQGIAEIYRVLKPNAWFCAVVFAGPDLNPCMRILVSTAMRHAGLAPRDPFQPGGPLSLGKPGRMEELFQNAGFKSVVTAKMDAPFRLPSTEHYLTFIRESAGPILQILAPLDDAARAAAWADIAAQLDVYQTETGWSGPNALLLTTGQR